MGKIWKIGKLKNLNKLESLTNTSVLEVPRRSVTTFQSTSLPIRFRYARLFTLLKIWRRFDVRKALEQPETNQKKNREKSSSIGGPETSVEEARPDFSRLKGKTRQGKLFLE